MPNDSCLVGSIYDAAIDSKLWPDVTRHIADYCGAEKVMLGTTDTLHPHSSFQYTHNIPAEQIAVWRDGVDEKEVELHNRWVASAGLGVPVSSDDHFGGPEQFLAEGGEFVAMLNRNGIRRQMVMLFELDHFRLSGLGLNNYDPFPSYASERMRHLAPHLQRALEISHQLASIHVENRSLYQLLELMTAGVILLDDKQRVRYTTRNARQMIMENGRLLVKQGALYLKDDSCQTRLNELVSDAVCTSLRAACGNAGGVLGFAGQDGVGLTMSVVPLSSLADYRELAGDHIAAAIFLSPTGKPVELPLAALSSMYGLTRREAQLCQAFVNEVEVDAMALVLGLKGSSVRSLLKSIYHKTGQSSRAGLMRLLIESRVNFRHTG